MVGLQHSYSSASPSVDSLSCSRRSRRIKEITRSGLETPFGVAKGLTYSERLMGMPLFFALAQRALIALCAISFRLSGVSASARFLASATAAGFFF